MEKSLHQKRWLWSNPIDGYDEFDGENSELMLLTTRFDRLTFSNGVMKISVNHWLLYPVTKSEQKTHIHKTSKLRNNITNLLVQHLAVSDAQWLVPVSAVLVLLTVWPWFLCSLKPTKETKVHPGRLIWNLKMENWKISFLFQGCIFLVPCC